MATTYATDGLCHNAEPGTYGHECGKPATWIGTTATGYRSGFCDDCKHRGTEARNCTAWEPVGAAPVVVGTLPCDVREHRVRVGRRYVRQPRYFADVQRWAQGGIFTSYGPGAEMLVGETFTIRPETTAYSIIEGRRVSYAGTWAIIGFESGCARVQRVD